MKKHIDNEKINTESDENAICATGTTGLIPSLAKTDYEMESYKEIDKFMETPICKRQRYNNHRHDL